MHNCVTDNRMWKSRTHKIYRIFTMQNSITFYRTALRIIFTLK